MWNHIHRHFEALKEIFLQIETQTYENLQNIGFNGRLVLEIDKGAGTFINCPRIIFAATGGITIKARTIKNRGSILTQGKFRHVAGHRADLDNRQGIIFAQKGVMAVNKHRTPPLAEKKWHRIFLNQKGQITTEKGSLRLDFEQIDNRKGLFKAQQADIHAHYFHNLFGKLVVVHNGQLTIQDTFDNTHGLIDCGGKLLGSQGEWQNCDGLIRGVEAVDIQAMKFENLKGGQLFSSQGNIQIVTERDLQQYGRMDAATGIILLSKEGTVWGMQGSIFVPHAKITIHSPKSHLNLTGSTIEAGELEVSAYHKFTCRKLN